MNRLQEYYRHLARTAPTIERKSNLEDYLAARSQFKATDNILVMLTNIDTVSTYPGTEEALALQYPIPAWVQESSLTDDACLAWWLFESPSIAASLLG